MLKKLVMKKLYREKDTHVSAVVDWYYMYIQEADELYFAKDIKQRFSFMGIPFKVSTSLVTMRVPFEITHLFQELAAIETDEIDKYSLDNYVKDLKATFGSAYDTVYGQVTKSLEGEELEALKAKLLDTKTQVNQVLSDFDKKELAAVKPYVKDGFIPMYKVRQGASISLYLGKLLYDRLVLVRFELMNIKDDLHFSYVEQMYLTKKFMKTFNEHTEREE